MNTKTILGLGLTGLLALGAGCTATTTNSNTTPTDITNVNAPAEVDKTIVEDDAGVGAETTQTFNIVAQQFSFSPSTITVNQGDTVVFNLTSIDVPHGFSLPQFNVSEIITPGETTTVEFVADTTGTFTFACSLVCGSGHAGMTGTLVVN